jgi:hypothetical protein
LEHLCWPKKKKRLFNNPCFNLGQFLQLYIIQ